MIHSRTYETERGRMVAAADAEVVGESFEEDGVRVEVAEDFYGGDRETVGRREVEERLREAAIANLVGERAVEAGLEADAVEKENVLRVEGVPHAQMVRI